MSHDESRVKACPICSKPRSEEYMPFCSKRCADIDLNKWFTGRYAIPVEDSDDEMQKNEAEDPLKSDTN